MRSNLIDFSNLLVKNSDENPVYEIAKKVLNFNESFPYYHDESILKKVEDLIYNVDIQDGEASEYNYRMQAGYRDFLIAYTEFLEAIINDKI